MNTILETYLRELTESQRLFHVSTHHQIKKLIPKIPDNFYTKNDWENKTIKRISVSTDIDHCLLALGYNVINESKIFSVYEPKDYSKIKVLSNREIIKKDYVSDAKQTKETWLLTPTEFKNIAKIKVLRASNKYETVPIVPDGPDTPKENRKACYWEWEVIDGEI